jgi:pimeloyl-ACP methyl ester carboxylesterase
MPATDIDGCSIAYEVLGGGVPLVLTPGSRNPLDAMRPIATALAANFHVLLWDRANIGASDVQFTGARDLDLWSDQLAGLLRRLEFGPTYLCAPSAGSRVSFVTALRYPEVVRGMFLWLVSAGPVGQQLGWNYYGQYAELAEQGGMTAVVEASYWAERIIANPANRGRLLQQNPREFATVMRRWQSGIRVDDPVFGATADDLRRIRVPTGILAPPASDQGHPRAASELAAQLIPTAELLTSAEFEAEWPGLQQQALANYEKPKSLPRLIADWIMRTEASPAGPAATAA